MTTGQALTDLDRAYYAVNEARLRMEIEATDHRLSGRGGKAQIATLMARGMARTLEIMREIDPGAGDAAYVPLDPNACYGPPE